LQRHRGDGRGQQAFETQGAALRLGESGAFVEARIAQPASVKAVPLLRRGLRSKS